MMLNTQKKLSAAAVAHSPLEVCMGVEIPIPMGFPWDSHGNGSSFGLLIGMGISYFMGENKIPIHIHRNMQ